MSLFGLFKNLKRPQTVKMMVLYALRPVMSTGIGSITAMKRKHILLANSMAEKKL